MNSTVTYPHVVAAHVEPALGRDRLAVVEQWPSSMAVLARLDEHDRRYARRFEVYGERPARDGACGDVGVVDADDDVVGTGA